MSIDEKFLFKFSFPTTGDARTWLKQEKWSFKLLQQMDEGEDDLTCGISKEATGSFICVGNSSVTAESFLFASGKGAVAAPQSSTQDASEEITDEHGILLVRPNGWTWSEETAVVPQVVVVSSVAALCPATQGMKIDAATIAAADAALPTSDKIAFNNELVEEYPMGWPTEGGSAGGEPDYIESCCKPIMVAAMAHGFAFENELVESYPMGWGAEEITKPTLIPSLKRGLITTGQSIPSPRPATATSASELYSKTSDWGHEPPFAMKSISTDAKPTMHQGTGHGTCMDQPVVSLIEERAQASLTDHLSMGIAYLQSKSNDHVPTVAQLPKVGLSLPGSQEQTENQKKTEAEVLSARSSSPKQQSGGSHHTRPVDNILNRSFAIPEDRLIPSPSADQLRGAIQSLNDDTLHQIAALTKLRYNCISSAALPGSKSVPKILSPPSPRDALINMLEVEPQLLNVMCSCSCGHHLVMK